MCLRKGTGSDSWLKSVQYVEDLSVEGVCVRVCVAGRLSGMNS